MKFNLKIDTKIPDKILGIESDLIMLFLPLLGVVLVVISSIGLFFMPKIEAIQLNRAKYVETVKKVKEMTEKYNYLASVDQDELKANFEYLSKSILPEKNSYLLVGVVRKIADKYGFYLDSFAVSPGELEGGDKVVGKTGVSKIPVKITLLGPKENYLTLVKGLETSLPILTLDNFEMKGASGYAEIVLEISASYIADQNNYKVENLTLTDLTLKESEMDLITRLKGFEDNMSKENSFGEGSFQKYEREDPFKQ